MRGAVYTISESGGLRNTWLTTIYIYLVCFLVNIPILLRELFFHSVDMPDAAKCPVRPLIPLTIISHHTGPSH